MTAHLVVPALDDVPATVSRMILEGLLRDELGFDGLVITDALEMRGISGTVGVEEGAVRALAAGADALCLGHDLGVESVERVHTAIVEAVHSGRLAPARLEQAARRIEQTRVAVPTVANGRRIPDVGLRAARRAIRTEGGVRLTRSPLVLELWPVPSIAAGRAGASLGGVLSERLPVTEVADLTGAPDDDAKVLAAAARRERQLVLVVRDAHRHAWERQAVETLLAAVPDAVVVELGLPLWRPPGSVALVAAYGAGRANLTAVAEMLAGGEV